MISPWQKWNFLVSNWIMQKRFIKRGISTKAVEVAQKDLFHNLFHERRPIEITSLASISHKWLFWASMRICEAFWASMEPSWAYLRLLDPLWGFLNLLDASWASIEPNEHQLNLDESQLSLMSLPEPHSTFLSLLELLEPLRTLSKVLLVTIAIINLNVTTFLKWLCNSHLTPLG